MAKVSTEIMETVRNYINQLEINNFHIKAAYLFGSYSKGKSNKYSDIDIALVSDQFEGNRFMDKEKIRRITIDVDYRLSPYPYNSKYFNADDLFIKDILETGVKIV